MKLILIFCVALIWTVAEASCLPSADPCEDVFVITEEGEEEPVKEEAPVADFHWTDEKDPVERQFLKDHWD